MASLTAANLIQAISWTLYVVIFVVVVEKAVQTRRRVKLDVALLFTVFTLIIVVSLVEAALPATLRPARSLAASCLLMAIPYFLIRLVADFTGAPTLVTRVAGAGLVLSVVAIFAVPQPYPLWVVVPMVLYFIALEVYGAVAFVRAANQSRGVTHRRMEAVAIGTTFVGLVLLMAGLQAVIPQASALANGLAQIAGVASAVGFFTGFAPLTWLRRAWQAPKLREILCQSPALIRLSDQTDAIRELEEATANTLGATSAAIGVWDEAIHVNRFGSSDSAEWLGTESAIAQDAYLRQRPVFHKLPRQPAKASAGRDVHLAALVAPVTFAKRRIGVLVAYTSHAPIFADEDLELVSLLADQVAMIPENRALVEESARERAGASPRDRRGGAPPPERRTRGAGDGTHH